MSRLTWLEGLKVELMALWLSEEEFAAWLKKSRYRLTQRL
jgi:heme-degrading monooxygenase HmoA